MSATEADVIAAGMEVAQTLDGTYGKTWAQVADQLDRVAADGERTYADPAALAGLIRALLDYGALRRSAGSATPEVVPAAATVTAEDFETAMRQIYPTATVDKLIAGYRAALEAQEAPPTDR